MNKLAAVLLLSIFLLTSCVPAAPRQQDEFVIIATLFPQYDFAREIAGDKAKVRLLMPPGAESHAYEPSPSDIIAINEADVFLYTGEFMETWAHRIIEGIDGNVIVVDVSEGLELSAPEDPVDGHGHGGLSFDPHIWTDPVMATAMVVNIEKALCAADPSNALTYSENADAYIKKLEKLDSGFKKLTEGSSENKIYFGGRFAMSYFAKRYGLVCESAFDSCSAESEPSAQRVAELIDEMKKTGASVVFYEELADPKIARTIAEATGTDMLLLHSCHNLSREEFESGESYLSLMERNLEHLQKALD
ncbi:MAG: High-affinity zinc uptake system binding-protein ZnuA precursor [Firmicutes bacterium ADurb.Bin182]|nr:MAG: High-affinity zinc uptake system binding-protein ZnuA precursor [Firmicutes bacterium ADurb.Bin182]